MSGEFEDRESGLGDLPEDILRERHELPKEQPVGGLGVPPDLAWTNKLRDQKETLGSPATGSRVVSTFDARPINAGDFHAIGGTITGGV